ncbi:MAG: fumarylacetoacetase [Planctomycetota bacterium]
MSTLHQTDDTHDPSLESWVESANDPNTDFPIQNLPYGVFHLDDEDDDEARVGIAIGDQVLDLAACCDAGLFEDIDDDEDDPLDEDLDTGSLGLLMASGSGRWSEIRSRVSDLLRAGNDELAGKKKLRKQALIPMSDVCMQAPDIVGDYTDFYASIHHATNVGSMFRPDNPLLPNYKWVPIAYHGRASTIAVSGEDVRRPCGQTRPNDAEPPVYGPCKLLDYELELGFFVGAGNERGERITMEEAEEHIFGFCLVNDWSARDMQKWEYQPLGPFLAKSFATTISPWVVTLDALIPFRCPAFQRADGDPQPLPHLDSDDNRAHGGIDITLEVWLATEAMRKAGTDPVRLSRGSFREMYWTVAQMLSHHASNGCALEPGDLIASGTVSGPEPDARGCLLELTWAGPGEPRRAIELPGGETRTFLEDGDQVILRGFCERDGFRRVGFGECSATILPAMS